MFPGHTALRSRSDTLLPFFLGHCSSACRIGVHSRAEPVATTAGSARLEMARGSAADSGRRPPRSAAPTLSRAERREERQAAGALGNFARL